MKYVATVHFEADGNKCKSIEEMVNELLEFGFQADSDERIVKHFVVQDVHVEEEET